MDPSVYAPPSLAAAVLLVPGLLVLRAFGVRSLLLVLGLTVPVSIGLAALAAVAGGALGLGYGAIGLAVTTLLVAAAGAGVRHRLRRSPAPQSPEPRRGAGSRLLPLPVLAGRSRGAAFGVAVVSALVGVAMAMRSWMVGIGSWSTYNQDHDTVIHYLLTAYIQRTGRAAPWQVLPLDLLDGAPSSFYPDGVHLLAAITGSAFSDPVIGLNATVAVLMSLAWPAAAAALTGMLMRALGGDRAWVALAAGAAAVIAATLYRPAFSLVRDSGVIPNAVALVLMPGVAAAILCIPRAGAGGFGAAAGIALAVSGLLLVHPSAGISLGLTVLLVLLVWLVTLRRAWLRGRWLPLLLAAGGAALLALPEIAAALRVGAYARDFVPDTVGVGLSSSMSDALLAQYGGFYDLQRVKSQDWVSLFALLGVLVLLLTRRGLGVLVAWLCWAAITLTAYWDATLFPVSLVAGFFYNSAGRLQGHLGVFLPAFAAVGLVGLVVWAVIGLAAGARRVGGRRVGGRARVPRRGGLAVGSVLLVALLVAGYVTGPGWSYQRENHQALAGRWSDPQFTRVTADDRAAARWLAGHVRPGQRVMNSANDGSTYAYVAYGVPVVNVSTLGSVDLPYTWGLLTRFDELGSDAQVCHWVRQLHIGYVYVDSQAPSIGGQGAPQNWTGGRRVSTVPGLEHLDRRGLLHRAFAQGSVSVYRVSQERLPCVQRRR